VDEPHPPPKHLQLAGNGRGGCFRDCCLTLLEDAGPVDGAAKSGGVHAEQGSDCGQQEHGRDGQLNHRTDIGDPGAQSHVLPSRNFGAWSMASGAARASSARPAFSS
jgi:hypothetical protein